MGMHVIQISNIYQYNLFNTVIIKYSLGEHRRLKKKTYFRVD